MSYILQILIDQITANMLVLLSLPALAVGLVRIAQRH